MIQKPQGEALSFHRGVWNITYYDDKTRKQKSTGTDDLELARQKRDEFFVNANERPRLLCDKKDKFIYKQKPYMVKIGDKLVGKFDRKEDARKARDEYLQQTTKGGDA